MPAEELIIYFISSGKIKVAEKDIIKNGIFEQGHLVAETGQYLFEQEYRKNMLPQMQNKTNIVEFNISRIHKELYDFEQMISIINNKQFTIELNECLEVYEQEKYFVAAAGLGSVLEHLLYLSIEKHTPTDFIKTHENSTASEYIAQLKKEPFNINKRDATALKGYFNYRNSVSHFNKGYFSKNMCDQILNGIKICFDRYYLHKC
ncbi:hypothetical protein [Mammaliicoccus vitulinus]|uniref:hypothetical protein n=1 Tax=Mammaliicoccus vitulinus TaxID=71237 RepID=UPI00115A5728|nr:hypothetical protein [Mammaliicoccus vitulinus]